MFVLYNFTRFCIYYFLHRQYSKALSLRETSFVTQFLYIFYCRPELPDFPPSVALSARLVAKATFTAVCLLLLLVGMAGALMYYFFDLPGNVLQLFAEVLGYIGAATTVLQYLPQIVTSYKLRRPGKLFFWFYFVLV